MSVWRFVGYVKEWAPAGKCPRTIVVVALSQYCPEATFAALKQDFEGVSEEVVAYVMATQVLCPGIEPDAMRERLMARFGKEMTDAH